VLDTLEERLITKDLIASELKLVEPKPGVLKARMAAGPSPAASRSSADLFGLLKGSEEIAPEDIDAIKIRLREPKV